MSSDNEDSDEETQICISTLHKQMRNSINLLEIPDESFISMFRVNKTIFKMLVTEMGPFFRVGRKNTHISTEFRIGTFLIFLATGSYQASIGRELTCSIHKSTVSGIISECLDIFEMHMCKNWINLKKSETDENETKEKFYNDGGIPGIVGCVDGTHIRIKSPGERRGNHLYYNRKGYYSLNVMVICDHRMIITFVDARHPGANHDSFVWEQSAANQFFKNNYNRGKRNTCLLGDGGYKLEPYMMTPYRNPSTAEEILFNNRHCKLRNIIERCFGVLKNRFRCLIGSRGLHYYPDKVIKMVNACCALPNICVYYKHLWPLPEDIVDDQIEDDTSNENYLIQDDSTAVSVRNNIARNLS